MGDAKRRREAVRAITGSLVRMGAERGQLVFLGWAAFRETYKKEMSDTRLSAVAKDAYYAGAQHVFHTLLSFTELPEAQTERLMTLLDHELTAWYDEQAKRHGLEPSAKEEKPS